MFSGIVEALSSVQSARTQDLLVLIDVERPREFDDVKNGDSISTNGVCLTVEKFDDQIISFALGAETLAVTGWSEATFQKNLKRLNVNLERSLRVGDRVHGHMVSGHIDSTGSVAKIEHTGGSVFMDIQTPLRLLRYIWKKGSWAVNGVSLTVNEVTDGGLVSMCLIPETIRRTNLGTLKPGDQVNLEIDMMARGMVHFFENSPQLKSNSALA